MGDGKVDGRGVSWMIGGLAGWAVGGGGKDNKAVGGRGEGRGQK